MAPETLKQSSFEATVSPLIETLYGAAWPLTFNRSDSADLVQETLTRAFQAWDRFDGRYPKAWLLTILRNTHINRSTKKQPSLGDKDLAESESLLGADASPEDLITDHMFDHDVAEALSNLPESQREVISLVDISGFSYAEASQYLKVPIGTVMSRLHRGRQHVRQQLTDRSTSAGRGG